MSNTVSRRLSQISAQTSAIPAISPSSSSLLAGPSSSSSTGGSSSMSRGRLHEPILLVCDIQEKFAKAIYRFDAVVATTRKLLDASDVLGFAVAASTQNAAKLGGTVEELRLGERKQFKHTFDKTLFSMYGRGNGSGGGDGGGGSGEGKDAEALKSLLRAPSDGRPRDVLLVGIETHICITQTTLDLLAAGHRVYVVSDGVSSCNREEKPVALARLARDGATVTTSESVLYEIMGDAAIPEFRDIAKLVKDTKDATTDSLKALHW